MNARSCPVILVTALAWLGSASATDYRFTQLNWLADDTSTLYPNSRVGELEIRLGSSEVQLLESNGGGFVNVLVEVPGGTGPQWSVQNLYLSYVSLSSLTAARPSVQFDLTVPNGTFVSALMFATSITPDPATDPPDPAEALPARVDHQDYLVGGMEDGGSGSSTIPLDDIGPWEGFSAPFLLGAPVAHLAADAKVPAVKEPPMHCASGACARSLKMMFRDKIKNVAAAEKGLAAAMGTTPQGTSAANMLAGKNKFCKDRKLPVTSRLTKVLKEANAALATGSGVEVLIRWNNGGGHVAFVETIVMALDGSAQITYLDDPNQKDNKAQNKPHVISIASNGVFKMGFVDGFLVETKTLP